MKRLLAFLLALAFALPAVGQQSIKNFLGVQGKRLGETVTIAYNGDSFTAVDGTVWKAANGLPLAYSATYSSLLTDAAGMVTGASLLGGPFNTNSWYNSNWSGIVGATAGGSTWLMPTTITTNDTFYTSTDAGVTWTARATPLAGKSWAANWNGTQFCILAASTTTNGAQTSTDAVTWTGHTAISIATPQELLWNGSTYLAISNASTSAATSSDCATWTSATLAATSISATFTGVAAQQLGYWTWNPGAALFIGGSSTVGTYQTSPTGATWTSRTFPVGPLTQSTQLKFASDTTTTTVVVTSDGFAYTSTNGTSWTSRGQIANELFVFNNTSGAPSQLYWDGTRFVAIWPGVTYYSTDAITWVKATRGIIPAGSSSFLRTPAGIAAQIGTSGSTIFLHLTDPTTSTPSYIIPPSTVTNTSSSSLTTYYRIK